MNREYQVCLARGEGAPFTLNRVAANAEAVAAEFEAAGFTVIGRPVELRVMVDWEKPTFDRDEAAAYLTVAGRTLANTHGRGDIPFSEVGGRVVYVRALLEKLIADGLNPLGKKLNQ